MLQSMTQVMFNLKGIVLSQDNDNQIVLTATCFGLSQTVDSGFCFFAVAFVYGFLEVGSWVRLAWVRKSPEHLVLPILPTLILAARKSRPR